MKTVALLCCLFLVLGTQAEDHTLNIWGSVGDFFAGMAYGHAMSPEYWKDCTEALVIPSHESIVEQVKNFDWHSFWGVFDGFFELYRSIGTLYDKGNYCYSEPYKLLTFTNNMWLIAHIPTEQWIQYFLINLSNNQRAITNALDLFLNDLVDWECSRDFGEQVGTLLRLASDQFLIFAYGDISNSNQVISTEIYKEPRPEQMLGDYGSLGLQIIEKNIIRYAFNMYHLPTEDMGSEIGNSYFWEFVKGFLYGHHISPAYIGDCYATDGKKAATELGGAFVDLKDSFKSFLLLNNQVQKIVFMIKNVKNVYQDCTFSGVPAILEFVDNVYNYPKVFSWWFWVIFNAAQHQAELQSAITLFINAIKFKAPGYYTGLKGGEAFRTTMEQFIILPLPF